jgi:hypothetical protein
MPATVVKVGARFGRWLVLSRLASQGRWQCLCDCGTAGPVSHGNLQNGTSRSCGCLRAELFEGSGSPRWKGHGDVSGSYWYAIQKDAAKRGIPFKLTIEYVWRLFLRQSGCCRLTGWPLVLPRHGRSVVRGTASLDRIENSRGYIRGNVQWLHADINRMKYTHSEARFIELCEAVAKHQQEKNG